MAVSSTGVMVMCSPNAFESDHIKREVYLADRYKKPMLPVFIADAQPPEDQRRRQLFLGVHGVALEPLEPRPRRLTRGIRDGVPRQHPRDFLDPVGRG